MKLPVRQQDFDNTPRRSHVSQYGSVQSFRFLSYRTQRQYYKDNPYWGCIHSETLFILTTNRNRTRYLKQKTYLKNNIFHFIMVKIQAVFFIELLKTYVGFLETNSHAQNYEKRCYLFLANVYTCHFCMCVLILYDLSSPL